MFPPETTNFAFAVPLPAELSHAVKTFVSEFHRAWSPTELVIE
ncbi:MAG TPA: hypothetical protein VGB75_10965 [Jatrophihabitans sp.]